MKGRKPEPTEVKEAKGNPGKRRLPAPIDPEVVPVADDAPPRELKKAAADVWRRLAPALRAAKFLRATDREGFARYCHDVVRYWQVTRQLGRRDEGETYWTESAHGKLRRINPLFLVQERLAKRLEAAEDRFGMNPAARQQILARLAAGPAPQQLPLDLAGKGEGDQVEGGQHQAGPVGLLSRGLH